MKIARFFAVIFAVLGVVLMLGTAVVCFASRNASVKLVETPDGAVECSEKLVQAINDGDYAAIGAALYGQPDLGAEGVPGEETSALIWEAFRDSLSCEFTSKLYLKDSSFARDAAVTVLDVASVTEKIQPRAKALLEAKVAAATDMAELYDGENNFREDLVAEAMKTAVEQALSQDAAYVTQTVTIKLVCEDGTWWAVPDQALLTAISGNAA